MYKNKNPDGTLNRCGGKVAALRKAMVPKCSQQGLARRLQLINMDLDKNAVQKIECGKRFVTDLELAALATVLSVSADELLKE